MKKNFVKYLCCLFALSLLLTGCAKEEEGTVIRQTIVLPTPTPAPAPKKGGELRLPMPVNAGIGDPLSVNTEEMLSFYSLLYEGLVSLDAAGKIYPCLAETWSVDASGRVWTFRLRKVRFHDGSLLTAEDVVYTFNKIRAMGEKSYYAYHVSRIESMYAEDASTLTVACYQSGIPPLYSLHFPVVKEGADPEGFPNGTGPYKLESTGEEQVRLKANPDWWKESPYITDILFLERDNNDTALASYAAGQLNMVPTSSVSAGRYRESGVTAVLDVMTQEAELLLVNHDSSILKNRTVRQALAYAIDRNSIITNVYMNRARASDVPIAPDSWLYESKSKLYDYSREKAAELLLEAGWADTDEDGILEKGEQELELTVLVCSGSDSLRKSAVNLMAAGLLEQGIKLNAVIKEHRLGDAESDFMKALRTGNYDLVFLGLGLSRDGNLSALLSGSGSLNFGGYADGAMEKLLQNVNTAADESAYRSAASALQLRFAQELPCIMLYFRLNSVVYSAEIMGLSELREPDLFRNADKWYIPGV